MRKISDLQAVEGKGDGKRIAKEGSCGHLNLLQLCLLQPLRLGSPVLKPNFHLRFGEVQ